MDQAERTKKYEDRRRSEGYVKMWLWVKPKHRDKIRQYAKDQDND